MAGRNLISGHLNLWKRIILKNKINPKPEKPSIPPLPIPHPTSHIPVKFVAGERDLNIRFGSMEEDKIVKVLIKGRECSRPQRELKFKINGIPDSTWQINRNNF